MKILLIEDEKLLADSLAALLTARGYEAQTAYDGDMGLQYARLGIYDLVILDVMMPGLDGCQVARQLRSEHSTVPILMLTAKSDILDRIEGLNSGADYYLTKPFDSRELLACIHALLRRQGEQMDMLRLGNTALDLTTGILHTETNEVRLSARESDVMRFLLQSGTRNISKETLLQKVWGFDSNAVENHVEVYVGFLRKKLKAIGSDVKIEAVRRLGYHLEVKAQRSSGFALNSSASPWSSSP